MFRMFQQDKIAEQYWIIDPDKRFSLAKELAQNFVNSVQASFSTSKTLQANINKLYQVSSLDKATLSLLKFDLIQFLKKDENIETTLFIMSLEKGNLEQQSHKLRDILPCKDQVTKSDAEMILGQVSLDKELTSARNLILS